MIEYLYNCIRASAGKDETVCAKLTDTTGAFLTSGCHLMIFDKNEKLLGTIDGMYVDDTWFFTIPAVLTKGLEGKHWYCVCHENTNLCFKQPIYFI